MEASGPPKSEFPRTDCDDDERLQIQPSIVKQQKWNDWNVNDWNRIPVVTSVVLFVCMFIPQRARACKNDDVLHTCRLARPPSARFKENRFGAAL